MPLAYRQRQGQGKKSKIMIYEFIASAKIELAKKEAGSQLISSSIRLSPSKNLDKKMYINDNGLPTKDGLDVISNAFIQGLVCCIHTQHQNGQRDSAEHLRYIISELERGFVANINVEPNAKWVHE